MNLKNPLTGNRICIRSYERADLKFMTDMWLDEENGRYMSDPTRKYVDETYQNALNTLQDSPDGYYLVIADISTGRIIGSCCAFPDPSGDVYDIGYCIHRNFWRQGYGSEALELLETWLRSMNAQAITAEVAVDNAASNRLLEKHGYMVSKETSFKKYNMDIRYKSRIYRKEL